MTAATQPIALPGSAHLYSGKVRDRYAPLAPGFG